MENKKSIRDRIDFIRSFGRQHRYASIVILLFLALVVYRAGHFFLKSEVRQPEPAVNVIVASVKRMPIDVISPVTGRLKPSEEVALFPMATGRVSAVYVSVGDSVTVGQVLFDIEKGQVGSTLNQARESYSAIASTYARMEMLYAEGAVSLQDFESAKAQYIAAKESYNAAAEAYANFTVTSPIDGVVTSLSVSVGSLAGGAVAGSVAGTDGLVIEASVGEALAPSVEIGAGVGVYIDSLGREYPGTITAFSPIPSMGMLTYPLTITMDPDDALFAGMFAEVRLVSQSIPEALCIPSEAVIIREGKPVVVVLQGDDIPELREVVPGVDNGTIVQILSGLDEGERIVSTGQHFVTSGIQVRVVGERP
jgi:RND family efflux transporter MFP subunit